MTDHAMQRRADARPTSEAWHVVQQAQGRVRQTVATGDGIPVNDDAGLERVAEVMGAKAMR
ncbi:hypothetical protein [Azospirillum thermophilum]|uniref:Uncharacterized protein n=1 Tax=Azospirillum thermophilum TaxID=2202148 RepID=A0A2S2CZC5_9PROT|nr:hypothetical protein [Azospirillum thermophilum]AWK89874.1 hypothetical protein DEW08_28040 [Azospirillum thermophilum]